MIKNKLTALGFAGLLASAGTLAAAYDGSMAGFRGGVFFGPGSANYRNKTVGGGTASAIVVGTPAAGDYLAGQLNSQAEQYGSMTGFNIGLGLGYIYDMGVMAAGLEFGLSIPMIKAKIYKGNGATQKESTLKQKMGFQFSGLFGMTIENAFLFGRVGYSLNKLHFSGTDTTTPTAVALTGDINGNGFHWGLGVEVAVHDYLLVRVEGIRESGSSKKAADTANPLPWAGLVANANDEICSGFNTLRVGIIGRF